MRFWLNQALKLLFIGGLSISLVRVYAPTDRETTVAQLGYLASASEDDEAADGMQAIFPEGYVFTWALVGLTAAQLATETDDRRSEYLDIARRAVAAIDTPKGRTVFDASLTPQYGVFYHSWSLYLRAELLREHFVDYKLGIVGVREYPHGDRGHGDVDSGPIILGFSGPAVVVGAAAARVHGDVELAGALLAGVEVAGVPVQLTDERWYALGVVPVGDAFIAWTRSAPLAEATAGKGYTQVFPSWWRVPWAMMVVLFDGLLVVSMVFDWRRRGAVGLEKPTVEDALNS